MYCEQEVYIYYFIYRRESMESITTIRSFDIKNVMDFILSSLVRILTFEGMCICNIFIRK